jgi:parvulin-like peptidyl-prolyl isomerase
MAHLSLYESEICMSGKEQSRPSKKKTGKKLSGSAPVASSRHEPGSKEVKRSRRQIFIIIGIVVVVILAIFAPLYYLNYVKPFNRTIITVDNVQLSMRYFLERTRLADSDPLTMLESLTNELVIKIMAPQYGIQVTDADIDEELRSMASGGTGDISDVEFNEWYRQVLNDNKVSDSQYREIVGISLLSSRLQAYLAERVPTVAEQIHLHVIVVLEYEEAQAVETRLEAGEDFATVAREVSIDSSAKENGGDQGWLSPVILSDYQSLIEALDIGEVSAIIPYYSQTSSSSSGTSTPDYYYIFMVSEKDSARQLDDNHLPIFKARALELWLDEEIPKHEITYNFNSEIYAWLNGQLQKSSGQ